MSAQSQELAGLQFPTKSALTKCIKHILHSSPLDKPLKNDDFRLIRALLNRHPRAEQKIGCGIESIKVIKMKPFNNRGFWLTRTDGSSTDFSYKECLNPSRGDKKFKMACRYAVSPFVIEYKNSYFDTHRKSVCELTGAPIIKDNCHVDHAPPWTFSRILNEFMRVYNVNIDKVALTESGDGITTIDLAHPAVKSLWVWFHNQRAKYRILHIEAHKKETKKQK